MGCDGQDDELAENRRLEVLRWRYKEARQAGLTIVEASLFAESDADLAELRRLVRDGCPTELVRLIVL